MPQSSHRAAEKRPAGSCSAYDRPKGPSLNLHGPHGRWTIVALGAAAAWPQAGAAAAPKADLVVARVTVSSECVVPSVEVTLSAVPRNRGKGKAGKSVTAFYLSRDAKRTKDDARLRRAAVAKLAARKRSAARTTVRGPGNAAAGTYRVVACADDRRKVKETNERNNCRAALAPLSIGGPAGPADSDGDGTSDAADCAPTNAAVHPGAADAPDAAFTDSNCDGLDGDPANAIFVSPAGSDDAAGTPAAPKRSIQGAIAAAAATGKRQVLAATGSYVERVVVANGVDIYGGFGPDWSRPGPGATE